MHCGLQTCSERFNMSELEQFCAARYQSQDICQLNLRCCHLDLNQTPDPNQSSHTGAAISLLYWDRNLANQEAKSQLLTALNTRCISLMALLPTANE